MIAPPIRKSTRRGFTLTEMLVVVAIIVVLASIAVPITLNVLSDAKKQPAQSRMRGTLWQAVKQYQIKHSAPPQSIMELLAPPAGQGILTQDSIIDPWGRPYELVITGSDADGNCSFELISEGP